MTYRSEIDGLRFFAVMPVILFHGGLKIFSGGFVGVDVFFVISGYLITTIIITGLEQDRFSLLDFYARRARRILPALFLVVACSIPFAWAWMLPSEFKDFAQSIAAVSLFSSNFLFWWESGYFAPAAELKPLLHTWSLAVEEQYYIFFPLILMAFWQRARRFAMIGLVVIFLASLLGSEWMWRNAPSANFYLLPTRAWELLAGAFCAIWMTRAHRPAANEWAAGLGLAMVLVAIFAFDSGTPFPSLYALVPVLGCCLIILFAQNGTWVSRFLSWPPFVGIGLISYSAYLWHQPLFAFARIKVGHEPALELMMGLAGLALGLAYLSWRFVEQPFRRGPLPAGPTVLRAGLLSGMICVAGAAVSVSGLHQSYFIKSLPPQNHALLGAMNRMRAMDHFATEDLDGCRFYIQSYTPARAAQFEQCVAAYGPAIVIFGDSHAIDVFKAVAGPLQRRFVVGVAQQGCRPHIAGSDCAGGDLPRFLTDQAGDIAHAFYVQAGFWLLSDHTGAQKGRTLFTDGSKLDPRLNDAAIERALQVLRPWAGQVPMSWIGPRVEPHVSDDYMLRLACDAAPEALELRQAHTEIFKTLDGALARRAPEAGLGYISEREAVQFDIRTDLYDCDNLYWSDGDHWSPAGEARFGPALAAVMRQALPPQ